MFDSQISEIEKKINYHFADAGLLQLAFTHRSYWNEHKGRVQGHNERLEFLGDSVLNFLVADFLYKKFPEIPEGQLTELRAQLVKAESCAFFLKELKVEEYFLLGRGEGTNAGKGRDTIIANFFEALMGAIYLDGGMEALSHFFFSHFETLLLQRAAMPEINWKAQLQDYVQKRLHSSPEYELLEESGPGHAKNFIVAILVRGERIAIGQGSSKKEAQVHAAKRAWEHYNRANHSRS